MFAGARMPVMDDPQPQTLRNRLYAEKIGDTQAL